MRSTGNPRWRECRAAVALQFLFTAAETRPQWETMTEREKRAPHPRRKEIPRRLPALTVVWIFAVIVMFVVVRIVGSNTFRHLIHSTGR